MKKLIFGAVLALFMGIAQAADNFTVWTSETFTGPFTGGIIATSATQSTTAGNNAVKVHIKYEAVTHPGTTPNVCGCEINLVIEEQIASGIWIPVASQHSGYRILDSGPQRVVIISPALNIDGNSDTIVILPDGTDMRVSRTQGAAPASFRVRLIVNEYTPNALTSIKVSAYGRQYVE